MFPSVVSSGQFDRSAMFGKLNQRSEPRKLNWNYTRKDEFYK